MLLPLVLLLVPAALAWATAPTPGPWTAPDLGLRGDLVAAYDRLPTGPWSHRIEGGGDEVQVIAPLGAGADLQSGLAALLVLAERVESPSRTVHLTTWTKGDTLADVPTLALVGLGHRAHYGGGQSWAGGWGWVLPNRGNFLALVDGGSIELEHTFPLLRVPRSAVSGIRAPPGVAILTDTGRWRARFGDEKDTFDQLDLDLLTRAVSAVEGWLER